MFFFIGMLVGSSLFVCALLVLTWNQWIKRCSEISCPKQIPWLGTAPFLARKPHEFFNQICNYAKEYKGQPFVLWLSSRPLIVISKIEQIEVVLKSQEMIRKSKDYDYLHDWLGTGLLTSWGSKWKSRRRALTPSFHFSILNDFTSVFIAHSKVLVDKVDNFADNNTIVDAQSIISHAALDVICETAMGVKVNAQTEESEYVETIHTFTDLLLYRMRTPWLWSDLIYQFTSPGRKYYKCLQLLQKFTTDVINKKIESRQQETENPIDSNSEKKTKRAFLDMLFALYDKGEIDVEGIREEVDTFMFEGHDTTASAISWILHELGNSTEVQQKLHQEIDAANVIEGSIMDKINSIKYLECVIKEGLRKHPPVAIFGRILEKDENIGGIHFPEGATVLCNAYYAHRCEEYWSEPERFKPERFLEDDFSRRNPYIYVPFSAGSRNCIGQKFAMLEMKVMLYFLLKNFGVTSLLNEAKVKCTFDIIHKSLDGLEVRFYRRKQKPINNMKTSSQ